MRFKDIAFALTALSFVGCTACNYTPDNPTEEIAETVIEEFSEAELGLPPGTLHGTIDLSPNTPEGQAKPPILHGTVDIKPTKGAQPTTQKPKRITRKTVVKVPVAPPSAPSSGTSAPPPK